MAKGHRSQIKRERNAKKDTRPSATLSYARVSVQKACFVLDAIRGKDVKTALGIVMYNPRYASTLIEKLLKSAIANAENNNGMNVDNLYVEECYANQGPTMKRIRPRAQGRAYRIEKRMSHITICLLYTSYHLHRGREGYSPHLIRSALQNPAHVQDLPVKEDSDQLHPCDDH